MRKPASLLQLHHGSQAEEGSAAPPLNVNQQSGLALRSASAPSQDAARNAPTLHAGLAPVEPARSLSIGRRMFVIFSVLGVLLSLDVAVLFLLARSSEATTQAEHTRFEATRLAIRLRQSSDDLTRMARTYTVTKDPIYERYFHEILAIRNGQSPRPDNYDGVYWDYVTAFGADTPAQGKPRSLIELMRQTGTTPEENAYLQQALQNSNQLTKLEQHAFDLMKGRYQNGKGGSYVGPPNPELARELLHGRQYHEAKAGIMRPLDDFLQRLDRRTRAEVVAHRASQTRYRSAAVAISLLTLIFSVLAFLHLRARVVRPIISLSNIASKIREGSLRERAPVHSNDELGKLAGAFNAMNDQLCDVIDELARESSVDGLTQIANRRTFDVTLEQEWQRCARAELALSLILIDVDFFKRFNDALGHTAGDECLRSMTELIAARVQRVGDLVARYGGEEFAIILPNTSAAEAALLAEQLRSLVEAARLPHPDSSASPYVTISLGVAGLVPAHSEQPALLVETADAALYEAKDGGRNRVIAYEFARVGALRQSASKLEPACELWAPEDETAPAAQSAPRHDPYTVGRSAACERCSRSSCKWRTEARKTATG